jgi:hypothetical protein
MLAEAERFADAMGVTQDEWIQQVNNGAVDAFKSVATELSQLDEGLSAALTKRLFGSGRLFSLATKLIQDAGNDFAILDAMLEKSTESYIRGTSSIEEYERIMQTLAKRIDVLKAAFSGLTIDVGTESLDELSAAVDNLSEYFKSDEAKQFFSQIAKGLSNTVEGVIDFAEWVSTIEVNWSLVGAAVKTFIGLQLVSFLASATKPLIGMAFGLRKSYEWAKGLFNYLRSPKAVASIGALTAKLSKLSFGLGIGVPVSTTTGLLGTLAALGKLALAAVGPIGIATAAVVTIYSVFKEDILDFIGFVSEEERKREQEYRIAVEKVKRARKEAIAKAQEQYNQLKDIYKDGIVGGERKDTYDLEFRVSSDAEEAIKRTQKLFNEVIAQLNAEAQLDFGAEAAGEQLKDLQAEFTDAGGKLERYQSKIKALTEEIARLEQVQEQSDPVGRQGAGLDITLKAAQAELQRLQAVSAETSASQKELARRIEIVGGRMADLGEKSSVVKEELESFYVDRISKIFDSQTAAAARFIAAIQAQSKELGELEKRKEELESVVMNTDEGAEVTDTQVRQYRNLSVELENATRRLTKYKESLDAIRGNATTGFNLNPGQLEVLRAFENLDSRNLQTFASLLESVEDKLGFGDPLSEDYRKAAAAALVNYNALKKLNEEMTLLTQIADEYEKTARSAFDNTATEIIALERSVERSLLDIRQGFGFARIANQEAEATKAIGKEYDRRRDKIRDHYDSLIRIASDSLKRRLEDQRDAELEAIDIEQSNAEADIRATAERKKYNLELENSRELLREANEAAKAGDVDKALALKDASKASLKEAASTLKSMQEITREMEDGGIVFAVPEYEISNMAAGIRDVLSEVSSGLRNVNKTAYEEAAKAATEWQDAAIAVGARFEKAETIVKRMGLTFENVEAMLAKAANHFDRTAESVKSVIGAAENTGTGPAQSVALGDVSVQIVDGIAEFSRATEQSQDTFGNILTTLQESVRDDAQNAAQSLNAEKLTQGAVEALKTRIETLPEDFSAAIGRELQSRVGDGVDTAAVQNAGRITEVVREVVKEFGTREQARNVELTVDVETSRSQVQEAFDNLAPIPKVKIDSLDVKSVTMPQAPGGDPSREFATGGPVYGPGTGTSDSIPAWLSRGEYVMDALTTSVFGAPFFKGLQQLAKKRRGALPKMKSGIPAFSGGGFVGTGATSVGSVTINLGGKPYTLYGERQQASEFVDTLKRLSK